MKKCNDCNCEMIENCSLSGKHPFEVDFSERVDISVSIPTGKKGSFLGISYDIPNICELKARICPKCGKVELYTDFDPQQ